MNHRIANPMRQENQVDKGCFVPQHDREDEKKNKGRRLFALSILNIRIILFIISEFFDFFFEKAYFFFEPANCFGVFYS